MTDPDFREVLTLRCRVCGYGVWPHLDWRTPETAAPGLDQALVGFRAHILGHLRPVAAPFVPRLAPLFSTEAP